MASSEVLQPGVSIRPQVSIEDVNDIVRDLYGLELISAQELNGYDDKNYHVITKSEVDNDNIETVCSSGYVLKIINSLDSKKVDFFEAQTSLLLYLDQNEVKCPRPVKTKSSVYFSTWQLASGKHIIRLLEYIDGTIFCKIPCTSRLFYDCGVYIAKLDQILQGFDHPAYHQYKSLWLMNNVPKLTEYLYAVKDESNRKMAENVISNFKSRVLCVWDQFEKGLIHGDYNEQNIIVQKINDQWTIDSVLDFGDTHYSCYLYELAISMTYMILQGKDIESGGYVLAGYTSVRNIPEFEYKLLKICIEARLCQSVVLGAYSILEDPQNLYVLSTQDEGWKMLRQLTSSSDEGLLEKWKFVADNYVK